MDEAYKSLDKKFWIKGGDTNPTKLNMLLSDASFCEGLLLPSLNIPVGVYFLINAVMRYCHGMCH